MPNHVTTYITFDGKREDIDELLQAVRSDKQPFDLDKFIPMPDELRDKQSPTRVVSQQEYDECKLDTSKPITAEMQLDYMKRFNHDNWYDWSIANWGTKWNVYDIEEIDDGFRFLSAWDHPHTAIDRLSIAFPDVEIFVRYADEDFGSNVGEYKIKSGDVYDDNIPDYGEDSIKLAIDIDGGDYFYGDYLQDLDDDEDLDNILTRTCIQVNHERSYFVDGFPKRVLERLLELAVADEQYERAKDINKELNKKS
jgi:hypothetical protein